MEENIETKCSRVMLVLDCALPELPDLELDSDVPYSGFYRADCMMEFLCIPPMSPNASFPPSPLPSPTIQLPLTPMSYPPPESSCPPSPPSSRKRSSGALITSPPKHALTQKERNKIAAAEYRIRAKQKSIEKEEYYQRLLSDNKRLRAENRALKKLSKKEDLF